KMIKVGLELGGKNPIIAMDDANVDLLMDGVMFGAFGTARQRCTAASRLIVHQKVYDEVVDELVERAEKLRVGNPIDEKTDMGPVASSDQEKKVLGYIDIGKKEGDQLLTGGKKLTGGAYDRGFFISPTVFAVDRKRRLAQEEIFGPVLSVLKAKDYEDAVAIANSVKYGLSSSIYTNDLRWAFRAMHELEAGITYINAPTIGAEVQLPFGGTKETGPTDTREAGTTALEEFTYWKTVYVDYSGRLQKAQIDTEKLAGDRRSRLGGSRPSRPQQDALQLDLVSHDSVVLPEAVLLVHRAGGGVDVLRDDVHHPKAVVACLPDCRSDEPRPESLAVIVGVDVKLMELRPPLHSRIEPGGLERGTPEHESGDTAIGDRDGHP